MEPFKALDEARLWRVIELSDLRTLHNSITTENHKNIVSRSAVVLSYAHWEGFYSDCCDILFDYAIYKEKNCDLKGSSIALGVLHAEFDRLFSKGNNPEAKLEFYRSLHGHERKGLQKADRSLIKPRSNLNFQKLQFSLGVIGGDIGDFLEFRLKIDKDLVQKRHSIAHGSVAEMTNDSIDSLTRLSENLMQRTKSVFEDVILRIE